MANVYNTRYRGNFCGSVSGGNIVVEFKQRMLDTAVVPAVVSIVFAGENDSPVTIEYEETDNYKLTPINTTKCRVNIKAQTDFELSSLYTTDDKEWQVVISGARNWVGFLIPDSCSEPYDNKPYDVSVQATDALDTLKDIPFQNADGTKIKDYRSTYEMLSIALSKTGLSLNTVIGVNTFEQSMSKLNSPLKQSFVSGQRYIDSDLNAFSCEEVIRSILALYSSRLMQYDGKWQIVNVMEYSNASVYCYELDPTGAFVRNILELVNTVAAGGQNRPLKPTNATVSLAKAFGNSTAYYQYGYIGNQLINGDMDAFSIPNALPDGWAVVQGAGTITASTGTRLDSAGNPTTDHYIIVSGAGSGYVVNNNQVQVRANDKGTVSMDMLIPIPSSVSDYVYFSVLIKDDLGKYYTNSGWTTTQGYYVTKYKLSDAVGKQVSPSFDITPQSVDYKITFGFLPAGYANGTHLTTQINNVSISSSTDATLKPAVGIYNKQSQLAAQTYTPDPILLLNGDDANLERTSPILVNGNSTLLWSRKDKNEQKSIMAIVANTELRLHRLPYYIFDGTFVGTGTIDVNTVLTVDKIKGTEGVNLIFMSGTFDLRTEKHTLRFAQVLTEEASYVEVVKEDYGTTTDKTGVSVGSPNGVTDQNGGSFVDLTGYAKSSDVPQSASNTETQAGTINNKYVSPLALGTWWAYIRGIANTISGVWNFTARPTYNGGNLLIASDIIGKADINSPTFTGDPKVPTAAPGDNDTSVASTAFVTAALAAFKGSDVVLNKTANYTVVMSDFGSNGQCTLYVDSTSGNINITPPSVTAMNGYTLNVIKTSSDTNSVIIIGTINGLTNDYLSNQFDSSLYKSNGSNIYKF